MTEAKRTFEGDIREVIQRDVGVLKSLQIDLGTPLTDQAYHLAGNYFYVWNMPDDNSYINVKINRNSEQPVRYVGQTGQRTPFSTLYITTPAGQAGTCILVYGTESPELVSLIDNRSSTVAGISDIRDELRGDVTPETWGNEITVGNAAAVQILAANVNRKACIIQARSTNTGIVYLGFDNTVTTTKWIAELEAGMHFTVDDYRGDLYARADALAQLVGWGEW